mmetsp:Transcript_16074/g.20378  ORF Transcript_16074/g.20378 Transcript_16074/m.20378 type:complete len:99 (+) Transcript_16074:751-1047(+)
MKMEPDLQIGQSMSFTEPMMAEPTKKHMPPQGKKAQPGDSHDYGLAQGRSMPRGPPLSQFPFSPTIKPEAQPEVAPKPVVKKVEHPRRIPTLASPFWG